MTFQTNDVIALLECMDKRYYLQVLATTTSGNVMVRYVSSPNEKPRVIRADKLAGYRRVQ